MIEPKSLIANLHRTSGGLDERTDYIRLDRNERTIPFPSEMTAALMARITPEMLVSYPSPGPLYQKLTRHLGVDREMLLLTNGSDAGIKAIFETYIEAGHEVLHLAPTYAFYSVYSGMFGALEKEISFDANLEIDIQAFLDAIRPSTRLVALANPNQPTGTALSPSQMYALLQRCANTETLLLVDEAYYPFYEHSAADLVEEFPNLIVSRTFSKAWGVASIRLGFLLSHPKNIDYLSRTKSLSDINCFALKIGEFLLDNDHLMTEYVEDVNRGKQHLVSALRKINLQPLNSHTNFLLVRFPAGVNLTKLVSLLKREGYLVRGPYEDFPFLGCIRITVGPEAQMRTFMEVLESIYFRMRPHTAPGVCQKELSLR